MKTLKIYDPAMCCPTGVCGTSVDTKLVQLSNSFKSNIFIERNGRKANAKSIMSLMMLAASKGSEITLICNGEDELEAQEKIIELFANRFGENE